MAKGVFIKIAKILKVPYILIINLNTKETYLLVTLYFHVVIFYSPFPCEKLKPTVIPQKKERSEPKGLKITEAFSLLNGFWVKFSVLNVQLNSALHRRDLHPQTD